MKLRAGVQWCAMLALASVLATGACGADGGAKPRPVVYPIASCVSQAQQRANGVTMTQADGQTVNGLLYGTGTAAVVFAAQAGGNVCQWQFNAQDLANKGYQTVVFDYSGPADAEVLAAVATVRSRGAARVFLVGASKGGTAVLTAAAVARPQVSGVVSLSGPAEFEGMNALAAVGTLTTPALFIVGDNDEPFTDDARTLFNACTSADKQLVVRHSGNHGLALMDVEVTKMLQDFLASH